MPTRVRRKNTSIKTGPATIPGDKWRARVKCMGIEIFLGTYDTEAEAFAMEERWWDRHEDQRQRTNTRKASQVIVKGLG